MNVLSIGNDRYVDLVKTKMAIGWPVPVKVAKCWDDDYELMRVAAMYELLERGYHAVLLHTVVVGLELEEFKGDDGKLYRKAFSTCWVYDLSELPEHLRDDARKVCSSSFGLPVIRFQMLNPIEFRTPESVEPE